MRVERIDLPLSEAIQKDSGVSGKPIRPMAVVAIARQHVSPLQVR